MRIFYVAMKYDYGIPERGYSFEHWNFHESLRNMGHELIYFDFMTLCQQYGCEEMNHRLWETVREEQPDLLFSVLFEEELDRETIRRISEETDTTTLNWFCDDHWRFENFSRHWAPSFNWVVTTAQSALPKYEAIGYRNVIKSQWGFNSSLYRRLDSPMKHDVTFVGMPHGNRRAVINALRQKGVDVQVWGAGWETGRIEQEDMISVFNQSRINLNLSNASTSGVINRLPPGMGRIYSIAGRALELSRAGRRLKAWRRARLDSRLEEISYPDQIKARNFEIPGCGGFQITGRSENLEDYFEIDKEVVTFSDLDEVVEKVRYFLDHEDERQAIASAGHARVLRDHSYRRRFGSIFERIGLAK